ncbi:glycosyltransferase [Phascolarctobacterium succinatutens]|uniref:glycosyltransferase n=1 Tax=Phascolarctobacterium succinatutens TaxID=626940 RepID=UPI0023F00D62|nr:glycosyltransferase family 2 protein [Phascolarctobacterium succinatutens]
MNLKIITYMRSNEAFNDNIKKILTLSLKLNTKISCIIFTDNDRKFEFDGIKIDSINFPGTKYIRLLYLFEREQEDCLYLSIDNDINVNDETILKFLEKGLSGKYDIGWGRIYAQSQSGFISNLVATDKHLSHDLIRPLSWKLNMGISIPGQCFFIRPKAFQDKLYQIDTFLDDLAIGAYISNNRKDYSILRSSFLLGYEKPNTNFWGLCRQRKRWAKGFYQIFSYPKRKEYQSKLLLHAAFYHFSWIVNWLMIGYISYCNLCAGMIYILAIALLMTRKDYKLLFYGVVYQLFFPIFHIVWFFNILRGDKNDDNA